MIDLTRIFTAATASVLRSLVVRLPPGSRSYIARTLMQDRFAPDVRALAAFFEQALHAWHNRQYVVTENGEAALFERLRPFSPRIMFDVGANIGEWSLAALAALPETRVHAFEIAGPTADILQRNTSDCGERLRINRFGLGEEEGEVTIYFSSQNDTAASTVKEAAQLVMTDQGLTEMVEIRGRITTGDAYMRANGIQKIDLLKIDVEGAEFSVLHGFAAAFADRKIDMVQFEYGKLNLSTRQFLGDYWRFFNNHGFAVGKLYPEGVAFKDYDLDDEDFIGPNFIACRIERHDIVEALRCAPLRTS
ncbi:MAG: FkbM family methyltransferase [Acetobacteraceae bacterium]